MVYARTSPQQVGMRFAAFGEVGIYCKLSNESLFTPIHNIYSFRACGEPSVRRQAHQPHKSFLNAAEGGYLTPIFPKKTFFLLKCHCLLW
jgi:hypothetical protein